MNLQLVPSPRLRRSPYFEATIAAGARAFTVYNHMLLPTSYGDPEAEYRALTEAVAVWDVGGERQVEIAGPDARRLVQLVVTRDVSRLEPGRARYTMMTNEAGGVLNDPVLLCLAEDRWWLSLADRDMLQWVQGVAYGGGWDVAITEPDVAPLQVQGPKSVDVMAALFGEWARELGYYRFRETELDGVPMVVTRTGWSGEFGYEIFLQDGSFGTELWERVFAAGELHGVTPGAPNQSRRIEGGILSYGTDMDDSVTPLELGFERLCDLDGPDDFIGKEALRTAAAAGVPRRLTGLTFRGEPLSGDVAYDVIRDGRMVGRMTSVAWSPRMEGNIGLGLLAVDAAEPGTAVTAAGREAVTHALPFVASVR
jgi:aminomethyltransferase